jgi:hypothetical protein
MSDRPIAKYGPLAEVLLHGDGMSLRMMESGAHAGHVTAVR